MTDMATNDDLAAALIGRAIFSVLISPNVFTEEDYALAWSTCRQLLPALLRADEMETVVRRLGPIAEGWTDEPAVTVKGPTGVIDLSNQWEEGVRDASDEAL